MYKGDLKGFPKEVVEKMLEYQVQQGNELNIEVFENNSTANKINGGFYWEETLEQQGFWYDVIRNRNFQKFFDKYPKRTFPRLMEVAVRKEGTYYRRVVIAKKMGRFIAWTNAESFEEAEKEIDVAPWDFAREIQEESDIKELTLEDIAKLAGVPVEKIRIKE